MNAIAARDPFRSHRHVGCHRTVGIEQRIQHQFARAPRLTIGSSLSWCTGCGCSGGVAHVGPSNKCSPRAKWRAYVRLTMLPGPTSPENWLAAFRRVGEDVTTLAPHRPERARFHAFGSSRESFADDVMDAFGAILCHRHSLTEGIYLVSLAIHVVSWTRFAGCMSRPLFLDMVLSSRRLPSLLRVLASLVPRSRRYYEGATTSHLRISGRLFCSLPPPT